MIRKCINDSPISEGEIDFVVRRLRRCEFLKSCLFVMLALASCSLVIMYFLAIIKIIAFTISITALLMLAYFVECKVPLSSLQRGISFNGRDYGFESIHLITTKAKNADVVALLKNSETNIAARDYMRLVMQQKRALREFEVHELSATIGVDLSKNVKAS